MAAAGVLLQSVQAPPRRHQHSRRGVLDGVGRCRRRAPCTIRLRRSGGHTAAPDRRRRRGVGSGVERVRGRTCAACHRTHADPALRRSRLEGVPARRREEPGRKVLLGDAIVSVPHESARGHVTGAAIYTDDAIARHPGLLHAWPVLAPHAHAMVTSLDATPVLAEPGVVAVLTGSDVPGEGDTGANRRDEPMFPTEVMFFSQPVAWVLATTLEAARQGAARMNVTYSMLPAVLTIEQAIAANSYLAEPLRIASGDMSVLASSAVRIDDELDIGGQEHFYLETQSAIAWIDESGGVAVQSSTQHPAETQEVVARVLGLPKHQITVECLRMGGAFGGKEVQANAWAAVAALGAWKTRQPVRVRLTRALDVALTGKRHPFLARYSAGLASDGRLEALRLELFSDGGWSLDLSEPIMWRALFHCDNAYRIPAIDVTGRVCLTHKTSQTAFRGFGGPQAMVVIEDILSRAARRLSIPADVIRERNFYRDGDTTHYGQPEIGRASCRERGGLSVGAGTG